MTETQIVFIDGGNTFENREEYLDFLRERNLSIESSEVWNKTDYLEEKLDYEVIRVDMPCRENASYEEWEITFEKYLPLVSEKIVFIGLSLGGTFLAKYLSENRISKEIKETYLIAAPFDDDLFNEKLTNGFQIGEDLSLLEENAQKLELMFARDDDVVPVRHADKYRQNLSDPKITVYEDRQGHFQMERFLELVEKINSPSEEK